MRMSNVEKFFVNRPAHAAGVARDALHLARAVPIRPGGRYLDVGCGTGAAARELSGQLGLEVTGIDVDTEQIAAAGAGGTSARLQFEVMDATRMRFADASFDVVATNKATHHIPAWEQALQEMARVLKPGGYLIYSDLVLPAGPRRLPTTGRLEALAKQLGLVRVYRSRSFAVLDIIWRKPL